MSLNLIRRLIKGSALTAQEHDGNLDKIETAVEGKELSGTAAAAVSAHVAAADPHPQYLTQAEGDTAYAAAGAPAAAVSAHVAAGDPHPQYLTSAEGDAAYAAAAATSVALANKANTGAIGSSGLTMATLRILGRTSTGAGAIETIEVVGATLANGVLTITGGGGATDLSYDAATRTVASSTGADAVLTLADATNPGLMSAAEFSKLASITVDAARLVLVPVRNNSGASIAKGTPVYVTGSSGTRITIAPADASVEATAKTTLGLVYETIGNNTDGLVLAVGQLEGLNTAGLVEGETAWLSETTGQITTTQPVAPAHGVSLGFVVKAGPGTSGIVYVKVDNGLELEELHDALIAGKATGQALMLAADGLWKNRLLVAADISDGTTLGRQLFTIADQAAARSAISAEQAGAAAAVQAFAIQRGNHTGTQLWSTITNTPTTLAGYGVTDALTAAAAAATYQPLSANLTALGANGTAYYLSRANHTGTQAANTITGAITGSGLTMDTARLLGRTTVGTGAPEEISVVGATLAGGVLTITAASAGGISGQGQRNLDGALAGTPGLTFDVDGNINLGLFTGRLRVPQLAGTSAGDFYQVSGVPYIRDVSNTEQRLLMASGNLASVTDPIASSYNLLFGSSKTPTIFNSWSAWTNNSGSTSTAPVFVSAGNPSYGTLSTGVNAGGTAGLSIASAPATTNAVNNSNNRYVLQAWSRFKVSFLFQIPVASDGTDTFRVYFGLYFDAGSFSVRDSAGAFILGNTFSAAATNAGVETLSASSDTYTIGTWGKVDIEWTGTSIVARLNNGTPLTVATGFPTATGMFIGAAIRKTAGTTSRNLFIAGNPLFLGYSQLP